ncbi:MAG TPA: hypothetical protein VEA38_16860 [Terriglobales bacterium]|nr:hypothetical protein [Terriglobales bacterium]
MSKLKALMVVLALLLVAGLALAANTNTSAALGGLPPIVLSVDGTAANTTAADASFSGSKGAQVVHFTVDGKDVMALVRVQKANNGLFIDVIAAGPARANLLTAVAAMNFTGRSHPSPTEDAVDTAVLAAAAN